MRNIFVLKPFFGSIWYAWKIWLLYIKLPDIGMLVRVFANGLGDLGSIPCQVIPKTQKMMLDAALTLSTIRHRSRVKWRNPGKGVAPSPTPWCSSYRKGSLQKTLEYSRLTSNYLDVYWEKITKLFLIICMDIRNEHLIEWLLAR